MSLTWQDDLELALLLVVKYPDKDPLAVRFKDLRNHVAELPDFDDDPKLLNKEVFESIQTAWYEEYVIRKD